MAELGLMPMAWREMPLRRLRTLLQDPRPTSSGSVQAASSSIAIGSALLLSTSAEQRGLASGSSTSVKFPGVLPKPLTRSLAQKVLQGVYDASEKTNGTRYLLMLNGSSKEMYLVSRENDFYLFTCSTISKFLDKCKKAVNQGCETLLDGELVQAVNKSTGEREWLFVVFDCAYYYGMDLRTGSYKRRMQGASKVCEDLRADASQAPDAVKQAATQNAVAKVLGTNAVQNIPLVFVAKTCVPAENASEIFDRIDDTSGEYSTPDARYAYSTDGVVFTNREMQYGHPESVFKWKPPQHITCDLLLSIRTRALGREWVLEWGEGGNSRVCQELGPVTDGQAQWQGLENCSSGCIVECTFDRHAGQWVVLKARPDKKTPNNCLTVHSCLSTLVADFSKEELLSVFAGNPTVEPRNERKRGAEDPQHGPAPRKKPKK